MYNSLSDELLPENSLHEGQNLALDIVLDTDHIDYSALGNIDPDLNILFDNNTMNCKYFTEMEFNNYFASDNFSLFNLNIRSLPKNVVNLQPFLEGININFSVLSFTETWLTEYNISLHNFTGYSHVYKLRGKRRGGGVSMFINNRLNFQVRNDILFNLNNIDLIAVEISKEELNTKRNVIILTLYRPPDVPPILFNEKLNDLLKMLQQENKTIFITGDFNINSSDAIINPNINVNNFQNVFLSYLYTPLIDKPTRVDKKMGTYSLLDNIYTNVTQITNTINSGVFKTDYSDHYSIFCVTDLVISAQKKKNFNKRDFSQKNISNFNKSLNKYEWDQIYSINYQNTFSIFQSVFSKCFMNNFPMKTTKIQYKNRLPYITSGLRKSIQYKHILRHIYAKNPTDENKQKCRTFNNKLTSLLRKREQDYIEKQLDINKADMSKSWKVIKEIIGRGKNTHNST